MEIKSIGALKSATHQNLRQLPLLRWILLASGIFSVLLLVYASIVPLNYQPLDWAETNEQWKAVPWLDLGLYNRADWVANALVVIPAGFFLAGFLSLTFRSRIFAALALVVLALSLAGLVSAIEYFQIWFPPRTVSQNDIWAGWIGAGLGPFSWCLGGRQCIWLVLQFLNRPTITQRLSYLCMVVFLAFVVYSVMPLDLVLSQAELLNKWRMNRISLGLDWPSGLTLKFLEAFVLSAARLFSLGVLLGLKSYQLKSSWVLIAVAAIGLEFIQVPIFSKYATSWDVVAGLTGGVCGFYLGNGPPWLLKVLGSSRFWGAGTIVMLVLIPIGFLFRYETIVTEPQELAERWDGLGTGFLIRYYYTSEYRALSNLAGKLIMFGGLGFMLAGWNWSRRLANGRDSKRHLSLFKTFWIGLFLSLALGMGIELGQIYLFPLIADLTDVVTYGCGYCIGFAIGWALLWGVGREQCL